MNDLQDEIEYLRRITAAVEHQSKVNKWSLYFALGALVVLGIFSAFFASSVGRMATPEKAQATLSDAYSATRRGDLAKALQNVNEVLQRNPRDFEAHYRKGEILIMQGNIEEARESFRAARDIFPVPKYQEAFEAAGGEKRPVTRIIRDRD